MVSIDALQSKWVGKELRHALSVREQRGKDNFPVIPLSLNGTKLGALEEYFGEEPVYIPVNSEAGGVEAAKNADAMLFYGHKTTPVTFASLWHSHPPLHFNKRREQQLDVINRTFHGSEASL